MSPQSHIRAGAAFVAKLKRHNPDEYRRWQFVALVAKLAVVGDFDTLREIDPELERWGREYCRFISTAKAIDEDRLRNVHLVARGFEPPYFAPEAWEHLARIVERDPNGLSHEDIYRWALAWFDREKLRRKWISAPANGDAKPHSDSQATPGATIAARMIDLIKDPNTHTWTCRQFAEKLGCQPSTVVATAAWKQLAVARELARLRQAEQVYKKRLDVKAHKRRWPKRKHRPDSLGD